MNAELKQRTFNLFNEALDRLEGKEGVTSFSISYFPSEIKDRVFSNVQFQCNRRVYDVDLHEDGFLVEERTKAFLDSIKSIEGKKSKSDLIALLKENGLYEDYTGLLEGAISCTPKCITDTLYHDPDSFLDWYFNTHEDTGRVIEDSLNAETLPPEWESVAEKWRK